MPGPATSHLTLRPIGVVHSPHKDKLSAPRQPAEARDVQGRIELYRHVHPEHALLDLDGFSHVWVIFWLHQSIGFHAKVEAPRSVDKRGVFATRSPYRPNPIGLSLLRLDRIEGNSLHVRDVDLLDGTPVLDVKPYVAYTDVAQDAQSGWLQSPADPGPRYTVTWSEPAELQLAWLAQHIDLDLRGLAESVLTLGPAPHPYRRIKAFADHLRLGIRDFRLRFVVEGQTVRVLGIATGYRQRVLDDPGAVATERTPLYVHRGFVKRFGPGSSA
jgi:tRNA-Thr(GGU) m(6)t(6)A37 methyltransferase TsaA